VLLPTRLHLSDRFHPVLRRCLSSWCPLAFPSCCVDVRLLPSVLPGRTSAAAYLNRSAWLEYWIGNRRAALLKMYKGRMDVSLQLRTVHTSPTAKVQIAMMNLCIILGVWVIPKENLGRNIFVTITILCVVFVTGTRVWENILNCL
jgi:hypothetical protein